MNYPKDIMTRKAAAELRDKMLELKKQSNDME